MLTQSRGNHLGTADFLRKCTPSVSRHWLFFAAGAVWCGVGIGLITAAALWLYASPWPVSGLVAAGALAVGFLVFRFGFSKIASKNILRIGSRPDKICIFAFQAWRSYILVVFMMLLGYVLRHLPFPKMLVAAIYLVIGAALLLSSSLYFEQFFRES